METGVKRPFMPVDLVWGEIGGRYFLKTVLLFVRYFNIFTLRRVLEENLTVKM